MNMRELTMFSLNCAERIGYRIAQQGKPLSECHTPGMRNGWWLGVYEVEGVI